MSKLACIFKALRLPACVIIQLPLLLGYTLAFPHQQEWHIYSLLIFIGCIDQIYICFSNDVADIEADKINNSRTFYSGGSTALIHYPAWQTAFGYVTYLSATVLFILGVMISFVLKNMVIGIFFAAMLFLPVLYHHPYFRWSYKSRGELLQAVGTGVILPVLAYIICQPASTPPLDWVPSQFAAYFASALSTTFPDQTADRQVNKKTFVVRLGEGVTCGMMFGLMVTGLCMAPNTYPQLTALYATLCGLLIAISLTVQDKLTRIFRDITCGLSGPLVSLIWILTLKGVYSSS
ncbi:MAG: UbiA family prenyltransferase [Zetaproteobacteria bacterium]|nr:UbiA family prenyltransferase [Zetaproteobacteria bacterium]